MSSVLIVDDHDTFRVLARAVLEASGYTVAGEASAILKVPAASGDNRVQANVKRVELLLPNGLVLSPGLANGLTDCTEAQFGQYEDRPPACPAASEIGDVEFVTPLIGTLTGKVYFGTPTPTVCWPLEVMNVSA